MRNGQSMTAYIIIGLIILIGFSILYVMLFEQQQLSLQPIEYPKEVEPLANFMTQCIELEAKQMVQTAANQGGFIDIPPFIAYETNAHLTMDDLGLQILPFWTVNGEDRIPPLDYIQAQLSQHVTNNTLRCLNEFEVFSQEYEVIPTGPLTTQTLMGEEQVVFLVNYPLRIRHKATNTIFTLDEFVGFVPIRFKQMYELAKKIMDFENKEQVLENTTINLMASDQKIPMDGLTLKCGGTSWRLTEIKDRLQRSLAQNLATIRIKNTQHTPFEMSESYYKSLEKSREKIINDLNAGIPLEESRNLPQFTTNDAWEYFHTYYDVGIKETEMKVAMDYNVDYGMHLNAQPNDNGKLKTNQMRGAGELLKFICVNNYHFTYDVQYPIRVAILDPVSNHGLGSTFQFAFPVLIDDNTPSRKGLVPSLFPVLDPITDYCETSQGRVVELRARGYNQEGLPATDLKDVTLQFKCVTRECTLGETKADDGVYRLRTQIPGCTNPLIKAKKEGYVTSEKFLESNFLTIELTKLKTFNLEVVRHKYRAAAAQDPLANPIQRAEGLGPNQEVTIYLIDQKNKTRTIQNLSSKQRNRNY